jgi:hypothetical protein
MAVQAARLGSLIESRHFSEEAIERYRSAFASNPARFVVVNDFLRPEIAARLAKFLSDEAVFEVEHGLYSIHESGATEAEWAAAGEDYRFFRFS